jgi:transcription initiation factor TFIID subunit 12
MEGSGAVQNGQQLAAPPRQASLIRPDQVKRLPFLDQESKARHGVGIQKLWDIINTRPANSPEQQQAYAKLGRISAVLLQAMKQWNAKTQQLAQQAATTFE